MFPPVAYTAISKAYTVIMNALRICNLENAGTPKVYITNGVALKKCIGKSDAIVYIWKPGCSGSHCYSLNLLQDKCNKIDKQLFIVAECYDTELMQLSYNIKRPILGIDTRYYNSNLTSKYLAGFLNDMTGNGHMGSRVLYFKNGVFTQSSNSINSLKL